MRSAQGGAPLADLPPLNWAKAITDAEFKDVPYAATSNFATGLECRVSTQPNLGCGQHAVFMFLCGVREPEG